MKACTGGRRDDTPEHGLSRRSLRVTPPGLESGSDDEIKKECQMYVPYIFHFQSEPVSGMKLV